ncbi:uncharacterized protein LOC135839218 [Planococcus citri]|uniref:uncharacterized protein LOC135839218 n=1 Tax=Planococcus citri TaxID=170843 RepID=UPI0031F952B1
MKFLSVVLVFAISLACAQADPALQHSEKLLQECNATYPVQQYSHLTIWLSISRGVGVQLSAAEKCFLLCLFRKYDVFDDNGNLRNGSAYVRKLLSAYPDIAKYRDVLMAQIFQIARSAKSFDDKCERAFVIHHQITLTVFTLRIARSIENVTHIKDETTSINAIESRENIDQQTSQQLEQNLKFFDALINDEATWGSMKGKVSTTPFCKVAKSMITLGPNYYAMTHTPPTINC